jgi:hypothetical protein
MAGGATITLSLRLTPTKGSMTVPSELMATMMQPAEGTDLQAKGD